MEGAEPNHNPSVNPNASQSEFGNDNIVESSDNHSQHKLNYQSSINLPRITDYYNSISDYNLVATYIDELRYTLRPAFMSTPKHKASLLNVSEFRPTLKIDAIDVQDFWLHILS